MIFPKPLYEIHLLAEQEEKKDIIRTLHELGVVHITESHLKHSQLRKDSSLEQIEGISQLLVQLEWIAHQAEIPEDPQVAYLVSLEEIEHRAKNFLDKHLATAKELVKKRDEKKKFAERLRLQKESLDQIPNFHFPQTADTTTLLFSSPKEITQWANDIQVQHVKQKKTHYYHLTLPKKQEKTLLQKKKGTSLKKIDITQFGSSVPAARSQLEQKREAALREVKEIQYDLHNHFLTKQNTLQDIIATLKHHYAESALPNNFQTSNLYFILKGYCTKSSLSKLKEALSKTTITAVPAGEDAPTKLENGPLSKHFQTITELFSIPKHGAVDPTRILTFFYPLFFGFMLSDVGYGLMLFVLLGGLYMTKNPSFKPAYPILGISALSTIFFGFVFGSFFGELVPLTPLYKDSFGAAMEILIISLAIGLVHLNIGIILQLIQSIKQEKSAFTILKEVAPLVLIEIAAVAFVLGNVWLGGGLLLFAALLLILRGGFLGIMDMTGYVGTWFSYARLLALSLATAGVALAVNTMAEKMHAIGGIGIVLAVFILVFGHLFNFVVNLIGSAINAARLNYVEFFGTFFEGGGKKFEPFQIKRRKKEWL